MAGELSPETHRIVEEYLRTDAGLASRVNAAAGDSPIRAEAAARTGDAEIASIRRTRSMLALQRWLFGLAIGFTAIGLSLSVSVNNGAVGNVHLMLRDFPVQFGGCLIIGAALWLAYYRLRRRLSA
jgi:hypothetical protein